MNILEKKVNKDIRKKVKHKLPFAVFVSSKVQNEKPADYKQVFTDIISDRLQEDLK